MQTDLCRFLRSIEIDRPLFIISRMYLHKALFSTLAYPYDLLSSFQSFPFVMPLPKGAHKSARFKSLTKQKERLQCNLFRLITSLMHYCWKVASRTMVAARRRIRSRSCLDDSFCRFQHTSENCNCSFLSSDKLKQLGRDGERKKSRA